MNHSDAAAERAVLATCLQNGKDAYIDVADILKVNAIFTVPENDMIWSCIVHSIDICHREKLDFASIMSSANAIGIEEILNKPNIQKHIYRLFDFSVEKENLRDFAKRVRRLHGIRTIKAKLAVIEEKVEQLNGNEPLSEILSTVETPIFELSKDLDNSQKEVTNLADLLLPFIEDKIANPVQSMGCSTGFPVWDHCIGGGVRPNGLDVIVSRAKNFKSAFLLQTLSNLTKNGVKCLLMDFEMHDFEQVARWLAQNSGVERSKIETGQFAKDERDLNLIRRAYKEIKDIGIHHVNVAGKAFDEHISIMRRWLHKNVKGGEPCVIGYDYLKLTGPDAKQERTEYDMLGRMSQGLKDFADIYGVSIIALAQQNRTATDDSMSVADSDKIVRNCTSMSIFRKKTPEEIQEDGEENGNQVMKVTDSRHGGGSGSQYINFRVDGATMQIRELGLRELNNHPLPQNEPVNEIKF